MTPATPSSVLADFFLHAMISHHKVWPLIILTGSRSEYPALGYKDVKAGLGVNVLATPLSYSQPLQCIHHKATMADAVLTELNSSNLFDLTEVVAVITGGGTAS